MSNTKRNTKKAPTESLQSDKAQGNTTVTPKTTRATKPTIASLQKEVESLKQQLVDSHQHVVRLKEEINLPAPVSKAIDVDSRTITYASAGNAVPSKYEQFKAWLVFKLYYHTSYFRGF